jgi:histone-binding protein RBBP4
VYPWVALIGSDGACCTTCQQSAGGLNGVAAQTLQALTTYNGHAGVVEDVAWHCHHPTIFGSCGDDKKLIIWDTRSPQPQKYTEAHTAEVNCVAFNPMEEWLLATGSADRSVVLHDMRMLHQRLHVMDAHREEVFQVRPHLHLHAHLAPAQLQTRCTAHMPRHA